MSAFTGINRCRWTPDYRRSDIRLQVRCRSADRGSVSIFRKRTAPTAPAFQLVERTSYHRVFAYVDESGTARTEVRQRVIIRDPAGVLRRAYVRTA